MTEKDKNTDDGDTPALDEAAVRKIGDKLRESYDEVVNTPIPDRFTALLEELEKSENPGKAE